MGLKQVILVRADLKLPKGKVGAQTAHAAVEAVLRSEKETM
ncbi:peptidyl-tRNA hydrolase, partial [Candidatus Woesearchaeota archaeon]|nr:peptidyl-tRNA hydrolase [Candidatus Woesearchaeota archaeon]